MQRNGMEHGAVSGVEWNGSQCSEWSGVNRMQRNGMECSGLN